MADSFGALIKHKRLQKDMSLRDLGKATGLDYSYIGRLEKDGPMPSRDTVIKLATAFEMSLDSLLIKAGYLPSKVDLVDALEDNDTELTAGGQPLTPEQRLGIARLLDNHSYLPAAVRPSVPLIGIIRAGIPLLSDQNIIGSVDIPADLEGRAMFALRVMGDSMVGAGISENDIVLCNQAEKANHGQIVVALISDETTLKFYIHENGRTVLRAANPDFKDIELNSSVRIQGYVIKVLKDTPTLNTYREFLYYKVGKLQEWNEVFEQAVAYGIKPTLIRDMMNMQLELAKRLAGR